MKRYISGRDFPFGVPDLVVELWPRGRIYLRRRAFASSGDLGLLEVGVLPKPWRKWVSNWRYPQEVALFRSVARANQARAEMDEKISRAYLRDKQRSEKP